MPKRTDLKSILILGAGHTAPEGRISVRWEREGERLRLSVQAPETLSGRISLEAGFVFRDGVSVKPLASGEYEILPLP